MMPERVNRSPLVSGIDANRLESLLVCLNAEICIAPKRLPLWRIQEGEML